MLLKVKNIKVHYGKAIALDGISLEVNEGSVVSIIGANGSGKSTILRALSGLVPLTQGEIWFSDKRIDSIATKETVKMGLVHVPEGRRLFPYLSVLANLKMGASLRKDKAGIARDIEAIFEHFPVLAERRNQNAGTMSGGEQQMLAVARGIMANPRLLLLDEPSLGLSPIMVKEIGNTIKDINNKGVSVLLVEQNIPLAFDTADKCYVLQVGKVVMEGSPKDFKNTAFIRNVYLGD